MIHFISIANYFSRNSTSSFRSRSLSFFSTADSSSPIICCTSTAFSFSSSQIRSLDVVLSSPYFYLGHTLLSPAVDYVPTFFEVTMRFSKRSTVSFGLADFFLLIGDNTFGEYAGFRAPILNGSKSNDPAAPLFYTSFCDFYKTKFCHIEVI